MTPTPKLRFVEREIGYSKTGNITDLHTVRILQQWWEKDASSKYTSAIAGDPSGEWRDVPIEKEQV